ncbi:hypothetical protein EDB81DRAFT_849807 [Dactylonectria macrodidyma]|uniref:Uncharacterized protein n=1 Tax=Dactylonectria macrodidyma TaxID=307937 RepID=A0A9P9JMX5_9HYPO|nr:hypothetical protein EDB81DRAFT_849807 [Dactylonectria macrodidyma]
MEEDTRVIFNNIWGPVLPSVLEGLEGLQQDDAQKLEDERDRRFNDASPSYAESGETTQPPSPHSPTVDEYYQKTLREKKEARGKSIPLRQFASQARRECERLDRQHLEKRTGRRQTLPWDNTSDYTANSENNVRSRWIEQGIWGDDWGPAWPYDSHPMTPGWISREGRPFVGHSHNRYKAVPGTRWGHEEPDPGFESESETQSEPRPRLKQRPLSALSVGLGQPKPPKPPPPPVRYVETRWGLIAQAPVPRPKVRDREASRPYPQFLYQAYKERDWIEDEMNYKARTNSHEARSSVIDLKTLDEMAYESVKKNWIEDGIWKSDWDDFPGGTWAHEDPDEQDVVEAPAASVPAESKILSETEAQATSDVSQRHASASRAGLPEEKGTQGRLSRSRSDVIDDASPLGRSVRVLSAPGQSKRSRASDTVDEQQPSKRPRHNAQYSVLSLQSTSEDDDTNKQSYDSSTAVTNGVKEAKILPRDKEAASTSKQTATKHAESVVGSLRRSQRIAGLEAKRRADKNTEAEERCSRSAPTKFAKKTEVVKQAKTVRKGRRGRRS